ncbi:hypothetical protein [Thalassoglobus sp.]|uniref:hypothetical protein n=1 Tax=Thalassoglobus sp. TaxID=2795869 RepID=UPI003AA89C71
MAEHVHRMEVTHMGKLGSSLLTFLFSVPVTAVGFMAIFGVPQMTPLSASPSDDIVIRDPYDQNPWENQQSAGQQTPQGQLQDAPPHHSMPAHGNASAPSWGQQNGMQQQQHIQTPDSAPQRALPPAHSLGNRIVDNAAPPASMGIPQQFPAQPATAGNLRTSNTQAGSVTHNPFNEMNSSRPSNTTETSVQLLTWHQASARLAELGIQKYHLERGGQEGNFLFVCLYRPADSPQVTHRFEAEGNDPLVATNQVISQIDNWIRKNYQANNSISGARF